MKKTNVIYSAAILLGTSCVLALTQVSCAYNELEVPKKPPVAYCDSIDATYSGKVQGIIASECAYSGCHEAGFGNGDFTTYNNLSTKLNNGTFNNKVFGSQAMPPAGFINPENKNILKCWYDNGALNN
jgi:hypothetical protein